MSLNNNEKEIKKSISDIDLLLSVYFLKLFSDEEHPVSVRMLMDYMMLATGLDYDNDSFKPIKKHLLNLCDAMEKLDPWDDDVLTGYVNDLLGGRVVHTKKGAQHQFYFEPFVTESDTDYISGAITTNRYLSEEEKGYLSALIERMNTFVGEDNLAEDSTEQWIPDVEMPKRPAAEKKKKQKKGLPSETAALLKNIRLIHYAISSGYRISFSYGRYTVDQNTARKISFAADDKTYELSPYAMFWNMGQYYLVGTYEGADKPIHFRVDRIISVELMQNEKGKLVKAEPVPKVLKSYTKTVNGQRVFDSATYTATYPLMMAGFEDAPHIIDAALECTAATLSILTDAFGTDISVVDSTIHHDDEDASDPRHHYIMVKIPYVEYNSMLLFCLQHAASVYTDYPNVMAVYPPELVRDVHDRLMKNTRLYDKLIKSSSDIPHPFIARKMLQ